MHLAERNIWRTTAKLLWAFEFSEPTDASGNVKSLDPEAYVNGLVREPLPFELKIEPRSKEHITTIKKELVNAENFLRDFE